MAGERMFGVGVEGAGAAYRGMIVRATPERFKSCHVKKSFSDLAWRSSQIFQDFKALGVDRKPFRWARCEMVCIRRRKGESGLKFFCALGCGGVRGENHLVNRETCLGSQGTYETESIRA